MEITCSSSSDAGEDSSLSLPPARKHYAQIPPLYNLALVGSPMVDALKSKVQNRNQNDDHKVTKRTENEERRLSSVGNSGDKSPFVASTPNVNRGGASRNPAWFSPTPIHECIRKKRRPKDTAGKTASSASSPADVSPIDDQRDNGTRGEGDADGRSPSQSLLKHQESQGVVCNGHAATTSTVAGIERLENVSTSKTTNAKKPSIIARRQLLEDWGNSDGECNNDDVTLRNENYIKSSPLELCAEKESTPVVHFQVAQSRNVADKSEATEQSDLKSEAADKEKENIVASTGANILRNGTEKTGECVGDTDVNALPAEIINLDKFNQFLLRTIRRPSNTDSDSSVESNHSAKLFRNKVKAAFEEDKLLHKPKTKPRPSRIIKSNSFLKEQMPNGHSEQDLNQIPNSKQSTASDSKTDAKQRIINKPFVKRATSLRKKINIISNQTICQPHTEQLTHAPELPCPMSELRKSRRLLKSGEGAALDLHVTRSSFEVLDLHMSQRRSLRSNATKGHLIEQPSTPTPTREASVRNSRKVTSHQSSSTSKARTKSCPEVQDSAIQASTSQYSCDDGGKGRLPNAQDTDDHVTSTSSSNGGRRLRNSRKFVKADTKQARSKSSPEIEGTESQASTSQADRDEGRKLLITGHLQPSDAEAAQVIDCKSSKTNTATKHSRGKDKQVQSRQCRRSSRRCAPKRTKSAMDEALSDNTAATRLCQDDQQPSTSKFAPDFGIKPIKPKSCAEVDLAGDSQTQSSAAASDEADKSHIFEYLRLDDMSSNSKAFLKRSSRSCSPRKSVNSVIQNEQNDKAVQLVVPCLSELVVELAHDEAIKTILATTEKAAMLPSEHDDDEQPQISDDPQLDVVQKTRSTSEPKPAMSTRRSRSASKATKASSKLKRANVSDASSSRDHPVAKETIAKASPQPIKKTRRNAGNSDKPITTRVTRSRFKAVDVVETRTSKTSNKKLERVPLVDHNMSLSYSDLRVPSTSLAAVHERIHEVVPETVAPSCSEAAVTTTTNRRKRKTTAPVADAHKHTPPKVSAKTTTKRRGRPRKIPVEPTNTNSASEPEQSSPIVRRSTRERGPRQFVYMPEVMCEAYGVYNIGDNGGDFSYLPPEKPEETAKTVTKKVNVAKNISSESKITGFPKPKNPDILPSIPEDPPTENILAAPVLVDDTAAVDSGCDIDHRQECTATAVSGNKLKKFIFFSDNKGPPLRLGPGVTYVGLRHPGVKGLNGIIRVDVGASMKDLIYRHNIILIVSRGSGEFKLGDKRVPLLPDSSAMAPKGAMFSYANTGEEPLVMTVVKSKQDF